MRLLPGGTSRVAKRLEKCHPLHLLDLRDCVAPAPPWNYNCRFAFSREPAIATTITPSTWTIKDAEKLYNMSGWGLGYFRINAEGHVTVHPDANRKRGLDLYQLAMDLNAQGVGLPLLLRFSDILRSRIDALAARVRQRDRGVRLRGGLHHGLSDQGQPAAPRRRGDRRVRRAFGVGLECGSKPELQAVLGLAENTDHLIVCNGYKDEEFMRLALMGQKLGHRCSS